ncbi:MAG: class I SAM-dependent methyltransferase [Planctomycetota bacterium]|jgi:O-methyltransferase involved in polyketide biosynthesis
MKRKVSLEKLKGVPATLLIPLRGRYLETKRRNGIIDDPKSVEIIDSIDHDFADRELPWDGQIMISVRTEIFDQATERFLDKNPDAVVVNLGCGLDTRIRRVDNGRMLWYDLDLSECIELREKFFRQTNRHRFVPKSILDFSWVKDIAKAKKTLFIAEGLFIYFTEEQVKSIVLTIKENFPGSELLFEVYSPMMSKAWHRHPHLRKAFSMFKWGVDTGRRLEKWAAGIDFLREWHYMDRYPRRWRWMRLFRFIPTLRKVMKIVHLRFDPQLN